MKKYRFKTRKEFELIGRWIDEDECPQGWTEEMNEYLGEEILGSDCIALCESNDDFNMDGWSFSNHDYVIIEEEDLLAKAKKLYPIGTKFYPAHDTAKTNKHYCIVTNDKFMERSDCIISLTDEKTNIDSSAKYGNTSLNRTVYYEGKWAEIVKEDIVTSLVGRWVKLLSNFSYDQPIGSYDLIIEDDEKRSCINLEKYRMCARERLRDGDLELMPEGWSPDSDIPEYVECISKDFYAIHLGRIYKLEPSSTSDNYCLKDVNVGTYSPGVFKPSTKEAYEAQNKPVKESSRFKIGDWVVITQYTSDKGKIGQILSKELNSDQYWRISNMLHRYMDCQIRLAEPHEIFDKNAKTFPSKWCLRITDKNEQVLDAWRKQQPGLTKLSVGFKGWLISNAHDGSYTHWDSGVPNGYTEITYEQFVTNVLCSISIDTSINSLQDTLTNLVNGTSAYYTGIDPYEKEKPLIENVQSISVNLRTKKKINKLIF